MDQCQTNAMERFFRGPAWRYQIAESARTRGNRPQQWLDDVTRRAADFVHLQARHGLERATQRYSDIAAAERLWDNVTLREHLQILVLGDCPASEIAERLGLDEKAVLAFESLHFDVRGGLKEPVWIVHHVISAEADRGNDGLAAHLRVAYFGGACAARALLDAATGLPVESAERLAAATLLLHAKTLQVLEMPLDEKGSLEVLRLASEFNLEQERIELEREKLAARMQRWAEHRNLAQARIDLERERLANQIGEPEVTAAAESNSPASRPRSSPTEA